MPKVPCPKCGGKATANARGPDYVHCRRCGGLVAVEQVPEHHNDPVRSAISAESREFELGLIRTTDPGQLRGGLK